MADKTTKLILEAQVDSGKVKQAISQLSQLGTASERASFLMGKFAQASAFANDLKQFIRTADDATSSVEELRSELLALDKTKANPKITTSGGTGGSALRGIGAGSTALSGVAQVFGGSTGIGNVLQTAGDITGAVENLGNLKSAIAAMGAAALPAIGVMGAVGLAVAGVQAVMHNLAAAAERGRKSGEAYVLSLEKEIDRRTQSRDLIETQTLEQAVSRREELARQLGDVTEQIGIALERLKPLADKQLSNELQAEFDAIVKGLQELQKRQAELGDQIKQSETVIEPAIKAREDEVKAIAGMKIALDETSKAFDKTKTSIVSFVENGLKKVWDEAGKKVASQEALRAAGDRFRMESVKELFQVNQQLIATEQQYKAVLEERAQVEARQAVVEGFNARIDAARKREAADRTAARIADMRAEAVKREKSLTDSYFKESIKATEDYHREELRLDEDYNLERQRMTADLIADLKDLAAGRDVAGFVSRQRRGETDLSRAAQDFGIDASRRAQDFARAQAERRAAFESQIAEERMAAQERLRVEQEGNKARVLESERLARQLSDLQARWAAEDARRARALEDQSYQAQINALRYRQSQLAPIFQSMMRPAELALTNFANFARSVLGGLLAPRQTGNIPRFASGSMYVPQTGLALIHEGEIVIPKRTADRVRGGSGFGGITIQIGAVGEVVTPSQLNQTVNMLVSAVEQAVGA